MRDGLSELIEISRLNGDFKRNFGKLIGSYLYLRSISAVRGRADFWRGVVFAVVSIGCGWSAKNGFCLPGLERVFELAYRSFRTVLFHG